MSWLDPSGDPAAWLDDKACEGMDPQFFYGSQPYQMRKAQTFCWWFCPVRQECLDFAMRMESGLPYRFGVYGGLTASDRVELALRDPRYEVAPDRELTEVEVLLVFRAITNDVPDPAYTSGDAGRDESEHRGGGQDALPPRSDHLG